MLIFEEFGHFAVYYFVEVFFAGASGKSAKYASCVASLAVFD
jgi:hypothetical protein